LPPLVSSCRLHGISGRVPPRGANAAENIRLLVNHFLNRCGRHRTKHPAVRAGSLSGSEWPPEMSASRRMPSNASLRLRPATSCSSSFRLSNRKPKPRLPGCHPVGCAGSRCRLDPAGRRSEGDLRSGHRTLPAAKRARADGRGADPGPRTCWESPAIRSGTSWRNTPSEIPANLIEESLQILYIEPVSQARTVIHYCKISRADSVICASIFLDLVKFRLGC